MAKGSKLTVSSPKWRNQQRRLTSIILIAVILHYCAATTNADDTSTPKATDEAISHNLVNNILKKDVIDNLNLPLNSKVAQKEALLDSKGARNEILPNIKGIKERIALKPLAKVTRNGQPDSEYFKYPIVDNNGITMRLASVEGGVDKFFNAELASRLKMYHKELVSRQAESQGRLMSEPNRLI